jgi:4-hydroxy-3-methylbut-2-enyl diphosphate reductase
MEIVIDQNSGFCFGVINAVKTAEKLLLEQKPLYCLGDIVHNDEEVERLTNLGLVIIYYDQFKALKNTRVLIRAHGEPPETYKIAQSNQIELIDATCPVVLNLQNKIKKNNLKFADSQTLIFGKPGHAEVVGLQGQTENKGIVIASFKDIDKVDFTKPSYLYAQTTQDLEVYNDLVERIKQSYQKLGNLNLFHSFDTICRRVSNRSIQIKKFAKKYDIIIFVSGEKSSNGLYLYNICLNENPNTYFVSNLKQINDIPYTSASTIGICGATSTPMWLMEEVKNKLNQKKPSDETS